MSESRYRFPVPPSVNRMYRIAGGRLIRSRQYRAWLTLTESELYGQVLSRYPSRTPVEVSIDANVDRRRDIDNLVKPTLDMLQKFDIIPDDRYVDKLVIQRTDDGVKPNEMSVGIYGTS